MPTTVVAKCHFNANDKENIMHTNGDTEWGEAA